jgi:hypothetical protein
VLQSSRKGISTLKIITFDRFKPGVTMETITPLLPEEAEAKRYLEDFPMTKAGYIEWECIPVTAPLPLESLFDPAVDVSEPFDRTRRDKAGDDRSGLAT